MPVMVVVGVHWGDEGKGRVVDLLARHCQVVARYSGGANAGHTVINDLGEFALKLVPSGIFNPDCLCIIGNGAVITPGLLLDEMDSLRARGVSVEQLRISDRAHVVLPYHIAIDAAEERARGSFAIGTTLNGIGPSYGDKTSRDGIRMAEFIRPELFGERLKSVLSRKNEVLTKIYGASPLDFDAVYAEQSAYAERLAPYVTDTGSLIRQAAREGRRVLLEGAQATLLDLDIGTYPFVTSSHPTAAGACLGAGLGPTAITDVVGVVKAYTTRVGGGPLPTELHGEQGDRLREIGHEYGTRTGRPRRCGWLDAVLGRYGCETNGVTSIAITRLDILDSFPELKIAVAYDLDGVRVETLPTAIDALERCIPIYETLPGWLTPTTSARRFDDLPPNAKRYVERIGELLDAPVDLVGVGPSRMQVVTRDELH
ncbi:MAG: adenylosuccinate synthase [Dehalococcoidia bacterium]